MTQLSNTIKLNLEMSKKLNLKATQGQDSEVKIMAEKAKRKVVFEKNLDPYGYCWTHGFRVTKRHSSQTFSVPVAGHQRTASLNVSWEEARQENYTAGWGWENLNY